MDALPLDIPESAWRRRRCRVCGGNLNDGRPARYTYAMQRQGWVKIGKTSNVAERLSVLRRSTPGCLTIHPEGMDWTEPLILLFVIEADVEHELHARWAADHAAGEWFLPSAAMRAWLEPSLVELL